MIAFVNGIVAFKGAESAIVEAGGIGYEMGMSANALAQMPEVGAPVRVFTYMQVRDDGVSLYGFVSPEEKQMFLQLISVSTVGPKMALAALSTFSAETLSSAIMASDVDAVSRIPGIGKKKASRIILELQGSLQQASEEAAGSQTSVMRQVMEDLLAMGFTSAEADLACKGIPEQATESEALQYALKRLGQ